MKDSGSAPFPSPVDTCAPGTDPKILIVEDEYIVAFDLQVRLKNLGYDVVGLAASNDDALLQANDKTPDLILMDIMLQGDTDGIETARQIQKSRDIPVIFLTANGDPATLKRAGEARPFSCLLKPFKERELKFSIDMALHHHRLTKELKAAREELEKRVAERTAELTASNQTLQQELARHRQTLAELREAQVVAKAADRAKTEFLSTISHELLTPMNGIIGMVDILMENADSAHQRDQLEVVQASAETLLGIITDLLDLSRMENGTMEFSAAAFNLREHLGLFLGPFSNRAQAKGLRFSWIVGESIPAHVVGDSVRIGQVLANLVNNAVKFTNRGEIEIKVSLVSDEERRLQLCYSVRDTGIGIPEDKHRMIFEPFVQADSSLSRQYGGAGLGLAIASRIAFLMGGSITVESAPKLGSTFRFNLWVGKTLQTKA